MCHYVRLLNDWLNLPPNNFFYHNMMWSFVVLALGSILPSSSAASPDSFERTRERAAKIRDDIETR